MDKIVYLLYFLLEKSKMNKIHVQSAISTIITVEKDLANWMQNLHEKLKTVPIMYLALPGSHNSMSYTITRTSSVAPDAPNGLQKIKYLGCLLSSFISPWCVTQSKDILTQLENGIRYLDFRLATKPNTDTIYICHALYGASAESGLQQVALFLNEHPGEIVIIDMQHFYAFDKLAHTKFNDLIVQIFGKKLLTNIENIKEVTIRSMIEKKQQVIIIYRHSEFEDLYWPGVLFPTPWPDTVNLNVLFEKLDNGLRVRPKSKAYITQGILTPDGKFLARHFYSNLRLSCGVPVHGPLLKWLNDKSPGLGNLNVSISDFVELDNWKFCHLIIDLNLKLLECE